MEYKRISKTHIIEGTIIGGGVIVSPKSMLHKGRVEIINSKTGERELFYIRLKPSPEIRSYLEQKEKEKIKWIKNFALIEANSKPKKIKNA